MILTTPRLTLRPLHRSDVMAITAALDDIEVTRWLPRAPHPYRPSDAATFIRAVLAGNRPVWAICPGRGPLVGVIGLQGSFGYWLSRRVWGQGYATEAGQALLGHPFVRAGTGLESGHFEGNLRSGRVLSKLGFEYTGELRTVTPLSTGTPVAFHPMILTHDNGRTAPVNTPA